MAQSITWLGASYSDVPAVTLPKTGGGTARFTDATPTTAVESDVASGKVFVKADGSLGTGTASGGGTPVISVVDTTDTHGGTIRTITATDISDTTAVASDVASGKYFYTAQGVKTQGTASGGTPSQTQHSIYFEFSDSTDTTITGYWDDSFISNAITATTPTTYGQKTVTLAQLDGVTWYEVGGDIPLNTELVDYTAVRTGYLIDNSGNIVSGESWECVTDYMPVDSTMTFTWKMRDWYTFALYDASKTPVITYNAHDIADSTASDVATGTLNSSRIPATAKYVVLVGNSYALQSSLSLIRTA